MLVEILVSASRAASGSVGFDVSADTGAGYSVLHSETLSAVPATTAPTAEVSGWHGA